MARPGCQGRAEGESGLTGIRVGSNAWSPARTHMRGAPSTWKWGVDLNPQGTNKTSCQLQIDFPKRVGAVVSLLIHTVKLLSSNVSETTSH